MVASLCGAKDVQQQAPAPCHALKDEESIANAMIGTHFPSS